MATMQALETSARWRFRVAGPLATAVRAARRLMFALHNGAQKSQLGRNPGKDLGRHLGGRC